MRNAVPSAKTRTTHHTCEATSRLRGSLASQFYEVERLASILFFPSFYWPMLYICEGEDFVFVKKEGSPTTARSPFAGDTDELRQMKATVRRLSMENEQLKRELSHSPTKSMASPFSSVSSGETNESPRRPSSGLCHANVRRSFLCERANYKKMCRTCSHTDLAGLYLF